MILIERSGLEQNNIFIFIGLSLFKPSTAHILAIY
jgi:hypothetical protein